MTWARRLKLYFIGFSLGLIVLYFLVLKDRNLTGWLPENVVREKLLAGELVYTRHGRCRMECRDVSEAEVLDVLRNGRINFRKSRKNDRPCPSYAMEGASGDQQLRIVFALCDSVTRVVTAIDLMKNHECNCD